MRGANFGRPRWTDSRNGVCRMISSWAVNAYVVGFERVRSLVSTGEEGQGMIEYGLLVALISIVAIVTVTAIGGGLTSNFQKVLNAL
jgi:pilus assembly protein Flp/PilA